MNLDASQVEKPKADGPGSPEIEVAKPATVSAIWSDLVAHTPPRRGRPVAWYALQITATALVNSGFHMVALWRVGALMHRWRLRPVALLVEKIIYHWYHCLIPCSVRIGRGLWVPHPLGIVVSSKATIGEGVWLRQHAQVLHVWRCGEGGVIGDRARINTGAMLLKGAMVGHDSTVAAGSVVTGVVPPRHLAIGVPAAIQPLRDDQMREEIDRTA